jgi:aminoglycoside phosphotransferase (APT) family kinase protein
VPPRRRGTTIKFDELFEAAVPLISSGDHQRDTPPVEGGRWPVSVVLRPPAGSDLSHRLDDVTREAAAIAGLGHWQTGQVGSAHLTVRALETYRPIVDPTEPVIQRYQSAMERAAAGPARFEVTGLTLTAGSVMASAVALDAQADLFLDQFATELGPDAWFEHPHGRRDIWYLNLLHFTSDIPDPENLITWVKAHRSASLGQTSIELAELVRFHHSVGKTRPFMRPEILGQVKLSGRTPAG